MKRTILALFLVGGVVGASAGNYELLVKAIRKMTDDIRYIKAELYQTRKEMRDLQDGFGDLSEKIYKGGASGAGSAEIENKVKRLEARLDAADKEIRAYWKRVIEQRKAILEEAKEAGGAKTRPADRLTPQDKADIEAIRSYLNE